MMIEAKQFGMSDRQIGRMVNASENDARIARINKGVLPWVKQVNLFSNVARNQLDVEMIYNYPKTMSHKCITTMEHNCGVTS